MIFIFLSKISSFVSKCKRVNSIRFVSAFYKYFIGPLLIFFPCFVEAYSFSVGNATAEYSGNLFVGSENLLEFSDSIAVENIDIMFRVKAFPELGGGNPKKVPFVQSVVETISDPCHTKNSANSKQPQISISQNDSEDFHSLIPLLLPMFIFTLIWFSYSIGYYRGKYCSTHNKLLNSFRSISSSFERADTKTTLY